MGGEFSKLNINLCHGCPLCGTPKRPLPHYITSMSVFLQLLTRWFSYRHFNWNLSDEESADMRIEKSNGNQHSKNEMAFPQLLQSFS